MRRVLLAIVALSMAAAPAAFAASAVDSKLSASRADLVAAILAYRSALDRLWEFHVMAVKRASDEVQKRRDLLERGIVSRRELEDSERALEAAEAKMSATRREMIVTDQSLAEAMIEPPALAPGRPGREHYEATPLFVQYRGPAHWSLADVPKVQEFFVRRFGRPLPVSAFGQTPVHDRLGFDHRDALDIAVMPDSPEGSALMAFLRRSGISFMAFRGAVKGEATGAHIHVGGASRRLGAIRP
jgi:hypothetical protein